MEFSLTCHPLSPPSPIDRIDVDVSRPGGGRLVLRYRIGGDIAALAVPGLMTPERADDLWQTTCFEAFFRQPGGSRYAEFNFSPSTRWASYIFDDYREGQQDFGPAAMPRIDMVAGRDSFELGVTLTFAGKNEHWEHRELLLGLSAVIETRGREKSYWALAHPAGEPDFHHGDCFAGILRAPDGA